MKEEFAIESETNDALAYTEVRLGREGWLVDGLKDEKSCSPLFCTRIEENFLSFFVIF